MHEPCIAPHPNACTCRDWDLAKYNDCLGSVAVDLSKPLQRAFRTKRTVSLFKAAPASAAPAKGDGGKDKDGKADEDAEGTLDSQVVAAPAAAAASGAILMLLCYVSELWSQSMSCTGAQGVPMQQDRVWEGERKEGKVGIGLVGLRKKI
jgi:hypothetical protein